jgi:hypothetical protein
MVAFWAPVRVPKASGAWIEVVTAEVHGSECPGLDLRSGGRSCGVVESYFAWSNSMKSVSRELHIGQEVRSPALGEGHLLHAPDPEGLPVRVHPVLGRVDAVA